MQATSLSSVDTEYSADSIEFCPSVPRLFACGTYQVSKEPSTTLPLDDNDDTRDDDDPPEGRDPTVTRTGRCLLFTVDCNGENL